MARIRSIHPGIYTDEAWASVSIPARWFAKGLCTEADDNGVFEWKPLQLKMRIFPADAVDVPALLAELVAAEIILPFSAEGRSLGAIRNFCRYQRPRKPKAWFPITEVAKVFAEVGSDGADDGQSEPQANPVPKKSEPVPQKSEMSPQMEDGGGRREDEGCKAVVVGASAKLDDWPDGKASDHARLLSEINPRIDPAKKLTLTTSVGEISRWRQLGHSWELDVTPAIAAHAARPSAELVASWAFFGQAIALSHARRIRADEPISAEALGPIRSASTSLADQIGLEKAEARRRVLAREPANGRA